MMKRQILQLFYYFLPGDTPDIGVKERLPAGFIKPIPGAGKPGGFN
jgi:hypothetical protein